MTAEPREPIPHMNLLGFGLTAVGSAFTIAGVLCENRLQITLISFGILVVVGAGIFALWADKIAKAYKEWALLARERTSREVDKHSSLLAEMSHKLVDTTTTVSRLMDTLQQNATGGKTDDLRWMVNHLFVLNHILDLNEMHITVCAMLMGKHLITPEEAVQLLEVSCARDAHDQAIAELEGKYPQLAKEIASAKSSFEPLRSIRPAIARRLLELVAQVKAK